MLSKLIKPKKQRPYLKLCTKCGGKGQTSYFNNSQQKTYAPCDHCSDGMGPYALGVCLKCTCQPKSASYVFAMGREAQHYKRALEPNDMVELQKFQDSLGTGGNAILILSDSCGTKYLCRDGAGTRRKISGDKELNEEDKEFNRHIAHTLCGNGILGMLDPSGSLQMLRPLMPAPPPARLGSTTGRVPISNLSSITARGSPRRPRPQSAPSAHGVAVSPLPTSAYKGRRRSEVMAEEAAAAAAAAASPRKGLFQQQGSMDRSGVEMQPMQPHPPAAPPPAHPAPDAEQPQPAVAEEAPAAQPEPQPAEAPADEPPASQPATPMKHLKPQPGSHLPVTPISVR